MKTGILAGSHRDLGGNPAGILARFWLLGFSFPAGIPAGSRQDSRRETKFPVAKISAQSCWESCQDSHREAIIPAAKISARFCWESRQDSRQQAQFSATKISPRSCQESCQDSRREVRFLARFTAGISTRFCSLGIFSLEDEFLLKPSSFK